MVAEVSGELPLHIPDREVGHQNPQDALGRIMTVGTFRAVGNGNDAAEDDFAVCGAQPDSPASQLGCQPVTDLTGGIGLVQPLSHSDATWRRADPSRLVQDIQVLDVVVLKDVIHDVLGGQGIATQERLSQAALQHLVEIGDKMLRRVCR